MTTIRSTTSSYHAVDFGKRITPHRVQRLRHPLSRIVARYLRLWAVSARIAATTGSLPIIKPGSISTKKVVGIPGAPYLFLRWDAYIGVTNEQHRRILAQRVVDGLDVHISTRIDEEEGLTNG